MKTNGADTFANAPVPKAVISNVIPSVVSMIMVLVYNLADTFFIGQTKNALMVAAVSIAAPAFIIFMAVGMMFGIGGTSFISRKLGQNNTVEAKYASAFCCWTGVVVGIAATILIVCFTNQIGYLVGASDDTILYAGQYLKIVAFSIPFLILVIFSAVSFVLKDTQTRQ